MIRLMNPYLESCEKNEEIEYFHHHHRIRQQKRGDIISLENQRGVKFLKWTDKRSLCMLTTSRSHNCAIIRGKNDKLKPDTDLSYNSAKKGVDISDQMCSYYKCLRKTVKWYRKVVMELICGISLVNAWNIHKK